MAKNGETAIPNPHEPDSVEWTAHRIAYLIIQAAYELENIPLNDELWEVSTEDLYKQVDVFADRCGCNDPETGEGDPEFF